MSQTLHNVAVEALMGPEIAQNLVESFFIGSRDARFAEVPGHLRHGGVGKWIASNPNFANGMWNHQAVALNHLYRGHNVVVTTSTGSGKSEIAKARALYSFDRYPEAKAIGFYPAKALQTDQLGKLHADFAAGGYSRSDIGIINGDEKDHKKRLEVLTNSRFVLMTPDVLHAWVLDNLKEKAVRNFLGNSGVCFIDEAHIYDRVLGSQAPYLFRRLRYAADTIKASMKTAPPMQFIAASASLKDAPAFLENLTGAPFVEVGQDQDGSRKFNQDVVHLAAREDEQITAARILIQKFLSGDDNTEGSGICFVDRRQVVERMAADLNATLGKDITVPYVGGYTSAARDEIQLEIRNGNRRFVICTSVLEMGVDFQALTVGICVGKPDTAAALQQRLGRVGRGTEGLFIVVAPEDAFSKGRKPISLKAFCQGGIDLQVYNDHPQILAINALSLQNEMKALGLPDTAPVKNDTYQWGSAFTRTLAALRRGEPVFDDDAAELLRRKKRNPHRAFGLRQIEQATRAYELVGGLGKNAFNLGSIPLRNAVYECYPGAIFHHRLQKYQVVEWSAKNDAPFILMRPTHTADETYPLREKVVFAGLGDSADAKPLRRAQALASTNGSMTECHLNVVDSVVGYARYHPASKKHKSEQNAVYYNTAQTPPDKRIKCQTYTKTTGVVLESQRDIFDAEELKAAATLIRDIYCDLENISRRDVDVAAGKVYGKQDGKSVKIENAFVIYDKDTLGLRFTSKLITAMPRIIKSMPDYVGGAELAPRLKAFYEQLAERKLPALREAPENVASQPIVPVNDILPLHAKVLWNATGREVVAQRGSQSAYMEVTGHTRINDELFYKIEPYDDPSLPKRRQVRVGSKKHVTHYVPRHALALAADFNPGG